MEAEPRSQDTDDHCIDVYPVPTTHNSAPGNSLPPPASTTSVTPQVQNTRQVSTRDISSGTSQVQNWVNTIRNYVTRQEYCMSGDDLFILVIKIIVAIFVLVLVWSIYIEVQNSYTHKFQVESLIVSAFNISDSRLTANWDVNISTRNKNQGERRKYKSFEVAIYHHRDYLSIEGVGAVPFYQPPKNQTFINVRLGADMLKISDSVATSMGRERVLGKIDFHIYIQARVRYDSPASPSSFTKLISVACKYLKVGFAPNATEGTMIGPANKCYRISNENYLSDRIAIKRDDWSKGVKDTLYAIDSLELA